MGVSVIMDTRLWKSDLGDGTFQNPILVADYSDPDVIRVEDTYYMTASSFNYIPGLPILVSKDMVNWELVNYALKEIPYKRYEIPAHAQGVWAPAIRYHEGRFYIYYGMPDEGIFMVSTADPLGEWDAPVLVLEGKGLIDSCPFWDEDGKAYVVHGYAKSRIGFKSILGIFPMSWDGKKAIGEDRFIYDGNETQETIEGPKVYKRDGYYYLFAPAGGVKTGWQTVLRSTNIYGPYEEKIVMAQGNTEINGPHQGALVDTQSGEEWFIHFQDRGFYGRIVHLQPVIWKNGWPIIGINGEETGVGEPCIIHKKPDVPAVVEPCYLAASDDFESDRLNLMWQWMGNPKDDFYSLTENPGNLRLYCKNPSGETEPILWRSANVLTQKLVCTYFEAEVKMNIAGLKRGDQAGMVMLGGQYAAFAVRPIEKKNTLVYVESMGEEPERTEKATFLCQLLREQENIWYRMAITKHEGGPRFTMKYSLDGEHYVDINTAFMPSDHTWVGAKIGLFALAKAGESGCGYADISYIHVSEEGKA